jgi:hypothetical protein
MDSPASSEDEFGNPASLRIAYEFQSELSEDEQIFVDQRTPREGFEQEPKSEGDNGSALNGELPRPANYNDKSGGDATDDAVTNTIRDEDKHVQDVEMTTGIRIVTITVDIPYMEPEMHALYHLVEVADSPIQWFGEHGLLRYDEDDEVSNTSSHYIRPLQLRVLFHYARNRQLLLSSLPNKRASLA